MSLLNFERRRNMSELVTKLRKTGDLSDSVSIRWGYGKIDAIAAVKKALEYVSISPIVSDTDITIYPNPANNRIYIDYDKDENIDVFVYNIDGKCIMQMPDMSVRELNVQQLAAGVYFIKVKLSNTVITKKMIIAK